MAVRMRITNEVIYGHYPQFAEIAEALESLLGQRGWTTGSLWMPLAGKSNVIVYEREFDDLAHLEREVRAFQSDAEATELFRELASHLVQGSGHSELLVAAPVASP